MGYYDSPPVSNYPDRLVERESDGWPVSVVIMREPKPGPCAKCGARTQLHVDGATVHARAGTVECPAQPLSEAPAEALLGVITR